MTFPVLLVGGVARRGLRDHPEWPRYVPWDLVAAHRGRVLAMFGHELETMARAGGISPWGLVALFDGVGLQDRIGLTLDAAMAALAEHLEAHRVATENGDLPPLPDPD